MKPFIALSPLVFTLFVCSIIFLSPVTAAEDGLIRQWLKERAMQREQDKSDLHASADINAQITKPGDYTFTIQYDGLARMYRVHVPLKYNSSIPTPLLFALHGGGGSMDYMADDSHYGLITASERNGFIVVFPNGYSKLKSGKFATWNAGNCCGGARDENINDVGFIRQVVNNVTRQMHIDPNRVYATGMSNGGMMSYRLACEMSDVFKAIASVAGTDNTRSCTPRNPVSILHIHARNDTHVLFTGGAGEEAVEKSKITDFTSVADTVSKWVRLNGCATTPRRVLEKAGAYCEVYSQCPGDAQVQLCVTETGAHSWPGAKKTRGEPASQAISANDIMWDFFNHH